MGSWWDDQSVEYLSGGFLTALGEEGYALVAGWVRPGERVLDVGCGPAKLVDHLEDGRTYVGVDLSPRMLLAAQRRHPDAEFHLVDAAHLPFGDASFDVIYLRSVLEHIVDWQVVLKEALRVARRLVALDMFRLGQTAELGDDQTPSHGLDPEDVRAVIESFGWRVCGRHREGKAASFDPLQGFHDIWEVVRAV